MRNVYPSLFAFAFSIFFSCLISELQGMTEAEAISILKKPESASNSSSVPSKFEQFTGKITKNKVRLRLQANYEGPVLRELNQNDLVVVLNETEDFYAIQPPSDFRAYIFRT